MRMKNHPYGAILTEKALSALIPDQGEAKAFIVNGVYPSVEEVTLTEGSVIRTNESDFREITYKTKYGESSSCLGDLNVGKSHNANYIFADRDSAEDHKAFMESDKEMIHQRNAFKAWCSQLDDFWL